MMFRFKPFWMLVVAWWLQLLAYATEYVCDPFEPPVPPALKFGVGTNLGGWLVLEPWYVT